MVEVIESSFTDAELFALEGWIRDTWQPGIGRVQENKDYCKQRMMWVDEAARVFAEHDIPTARIRTWLNCQQPDHNRGLYDKGYPHVHADESATTAVLYVYSGEFRAKLHILEQGEVVEVITPRPGKIVLISNGVWHGVEKNRGRDARLALIATAYPI